jgi:hypothetical protein
MLQSIVTRDKHRRKPQQNYIKSKDRFNQYLAHKNEPIGHEVSGVSPAIEARLMINRTLLKRQVWKNIKRTRHISDYGF